MGLEKQGRLAIIAAERGPLEHQLYAAEVELETKEIAVAHGVTGVTQDMVQEVKARKEALEDQIRMLDQRKQGVEAEGDED